MAFRSFVSKVIVRSLPSRSQTRSFQFVSFVRNRGVRHVKRSFKTLRKLFVTFVIVRSSSRSVQSSFVASSQR